MADGDRNHVTIQVEAMLAKAQPLYTNECCIYRVPHVIRQLNQDAYTPQVVSVGPFHHGNTKLINMEGHKQVYCQHFMLCKSLNQRFVVVTRGTLSLEWTKPGVSPPTSSIAHFTDLLRTIYLQPSNGRPPRTDELLTLRYSASELNEAGVKFEVNETSHNLLDFEFSGHILKIPLIEVEDATEILLRNMVALEQYHYPRESYITDYITLLDLLINTNKDVDVLVKDGVILNYIGDNNTVAELFNGLAKNITVPNSNTDYLRICNELNAYYEDPWHTKMATLRRDYCNTPWTTVASIAGIVLLILTVIQTVCSILSIV